MDGSHRCTYGEYQGLFRGFDSGGYLIRWRRVKAFRSDVAHGARPCALRRRPRALDGDGKAAARHGGDECIGGVGVAGGNWEFDEKVAREAAKRSNDGRRAGRMYGMGWWSDVLADAIQALGQARDRRLLQPLEGKAREVCRPSTAARPAASYEEILGDSNIEAIINTTPNAVHLETTLAAAKAGKPTFLDKADRQHHRRRAHHQRSLPQGQGGSRPGLSTAARKPFFAGSRSISAASAKLVNARGQHQPRPPGPDRPQLRGATPPKACRAG